MVKHFCGSNCIDQYGLLNQPNMRSHKAFGEINRFFTDSTFRNGLLLPTSDFNYKPPISNPLHLPIFRLDIVANGSNFDYFLFILDQVCVYFCLCHIEGAVIKHVYILFYF